MSILNSLMLSFEDTPPEYNRPFIAYCINTNSVFLGTRVTEEYRTTHNIANTVPFQEYNGLLVQPYLTERGQRTLHTAASLVTLPIGGYWKYEYLDSDSNEVVEYTNPEFSSLVNIPNGIEGIQV